MTTDHDPLAEAGRAFGIAVGAAAIFGMVMTMFGKKESKQEQAQRQLDRRMEALETTADQTLTQLNDMVSDFRVLVATNGDIPKTAGAHLSRSAARQADRVVAAVLTRAQELEQDAKRIGAVAKDQDLGSDISTQANQIVARFKDRSVDLLAEGKRLAPDWKNKAAVAAAEARERTESYIDEVPDMRDQAEKLAHDIADQARSRTPELQAKGQELMSKAREVADDVAAQAREKAPEVQSKASKLLARAGSEVDHLSAQAREKGPGLVEGVAHQLATAIEDAQKSARPVLQDVTTAATGVLEQARHAGEELLPETQDHTRHIGGALGHQKEAAVSGIQSLGANTTQKLAHTTSVVETKSKDAAAAAGRGTKELGALVGWSAALGGVVYYAFLKPGQREKVKASAKRIGDEAWQVFQEIRGQDGQF